MRKEIKFQAFLKATGEIIPVYDINFTSRMINTQTAWRTFDEIELLQYSGYTDSNGKEIYEGYIIRNFFTSPVTYERHEQILICKWGLDGFVFEDIKDHMNRVLSSCEIIGTIFQNPELRGK